MQTVPPTYLTAIDSTGRDKCSFQISEVDGKHNRHERLRGRDNGGSHKSPMRPDQTVMTATVVVNAIQGREVYV